MSVNYQKFIAYLDVLAVDEGGGLVHDAYQIRDELVDHLLLLIVVVLEGVVEEEVRLPLVKVLVNHLETKSLS